MNAFHFAALSLLLAAPGALHAQSPNLPLVWNRKADFVPMQNPHPDSAGNLVWSYQTHRINRPGGAVWSPAWGGWQTGGGARFAGGGLMNADAINAWLKSDFWHCWQCSIMESRFTNTTSTPFKIRIEGTLRLAWFDPFSQPITYSDAWVRIAHNPLASHVNYLYDEVHSHSPAPGGNGPTTNISIGPIDMQPGDMILLQIQGLTSSGANNTWLRLLDSQLNYVRIVDASETPRFAVPANPLTLDPGVTSGPLLGASWDPMLQAPAASTITGLALGSATTLPTPFGTLLCSPLEVLAGTPGTAFSVPIPADVTLLGAQIATQGVALDGLGDLQLSNALDLVLGNG